MYEIAIVEDNAAEAARLTQYLERFSKENGTELEAVLFKNAHAFMDAFRYQFDIVFMDIELPGISGMDTARWLRERDGTVTLIFVTHLMQYAVNGYEVDALDYIVKPVEYPTFALKMRRAVQQREILQDREVTLDTREGMIRVSAEKIKYVEIYNHHIYYHLTDGDYEGYGTLKQVEERLPDRGFFRCNSSCIVNLRYVEQLKGPDIYIDGKALGLSRLRKKDFLAALLSWHTGTQTEGSDQVQP